MQRAVFASQVAVALRLAGGNVSREASQRAEHGNDDLYYPTQLRSAHPQRVAWRWDPDLLVAMVRIITSCTLVSLS